MKTKIDKDRVNDAEYMKEELNTNHRNVGFLGDTLRSDPNFILEVLQMKDFKFYWSLIKNMDDNLRTDIDFLVKCVNVLLERGAINTSNFYHFTQALPSNFIKDNNEFWATMRALGVTNKENIHTHKGIDYDDIDYYRKRMLQRKKSIMEKIDSITPKEFFHISNAVDRDNREFMLDVLSKNENIYPCLGNSLKSDKAFIDLVISLNPRIGKFVEEEVEKNRQEKIERQKGIEKRRELKQEAEKDRIIHEYLELGKEHPNMVLIHRFLDSNITKANFCMTNNIKIKDLDIAINEAALAFPEILEMVQEKNSQSCAIHFGIIDDINKKLLSGEMTLAQYSREKFANKKIDQLLEGLKSTKDRKKMHSIILNSIASGELKMMDFVRLFSHKYDCKTVVNSLNSYINVASREIPELQGKNMPINISKMKIGSLNKYIKPFQTKDFLDSQIGFLDNEGKMQMVTIDDRFIDYAKKYLHLEDEYICYFTMNKTLMEIAKGNITFASIDDRMDKTKHSISEVTSTILDRTIDGISDTMSEINTAKESYKDKNNTGVDR